MPTTISPPSGSATGASYDFHPIHISKSAIAALTLPLAPSAICRVIEMGAPHERARNAARDYVVRWLEADRLEAGLEAFR